MLHVKSLDEENLCLTRRPKSRAASTLKLLKDLESQRLHCLRNHQYDKAAQLREEYLASLKKYVSFICFI